VRTAKARAALPATVPLADAVFNVGSASLLVLGLARGDLELVARGLVDRLHQPPRTPLYPRSMELVASARSLGALGATISGAGPTVLLWTRAAEADAVAGAARAAVASWADVRRVGFAPAGASAQVLE
jgi:homoserine kinase